MRSYTPRKKRKVKPAIKTKLVRVDSKTQIEVSVDIPDDVAIERYYQRHTTVVRPPVVTQHPLTPDECFEQPDED